MVDFLYSAQLKLARANEHFKTLKREMIAYGERKPHNVSYERNADATYHALRLNVIEEPPFPRWSLIAGDCFNNLRASLDHLVVGLAVSRSWPNAPADADALAFPICDGPDHFTNSLRKIGDLQEESTFLAAIESLQPYNRRQRPHVPALLLLRDLNNRDKHRVITLTRAVIEQGTVPVQGLPPGVTIRGQNLLGGPLKDGTVIFSISLDRPAPHVKMDFDFTFFPAIRHAPDENGSNRSAVDWLLEYIRDEVAYCLTTLQGFVKPQ